MVGQRGSVWFLWNGGAGPGKALSCSIPEGASVFFPLAVAFAWNAPNHCGQGPENITVKEMRAFAKGVIDGITDASAELDGAPVNKISRVQSDVFWLALPTDNVLLPLCGGDQPPGIFSPAAGEGYFVLLKPLSVGKHTLHYSAAGIDVTWNLAVVPVTTK